jgi:hypothetical protein
MKLSITFIVALLALHACSQVLTEPESPPGSISPAPNGQGSTAGLNIPSEPA